MDIEYKDINKEYIMVTYLSDHWELRGSRTTTIRNSPDIVCDPGETFYIDNVLNDISIEDIKENIKLRRRVGTLFIKVRSKEDREIENIWEGFVDNFKIEQDVIKFKVHLVRLLEDIPPKYKRYAREDGWSKIDDTQKDIESSWE